MKKQKILLFGGSGFLGSRLLEQLKPNDIIAPTHTELNLLNVENVYKQIEKNQPNTILYAAGVTRIESAEMDRDLAFTLNANIPGQIAKSVANKKIKFIYISTDAVFDGYKNKYMFDENEKPNPRSTYGINKLKGEEAVLNANVNNTIIRLITLFGIDYHRTNFLTKVFKDLQANKEIFGIIDQIQNPTEVDIAAKAISFIAQEQLNGLYHLGSLDWDTNYNFILKFTKKFGFNESLIKKITFKEFMKNKTAYRKQNSILLCNKFNEFSQNEILCTLNNSFDLLFKNLR